MITTLAGADGPRFRSACLGQFQKVEMGHFSRVPKRERFSAIRENGAGSHHLGTTRMAFSPMWGVADENCRIFGVDNLYVASRSLFPTSGCADPTLTTVALAIRLADHLKQVHARGAAQFVMPVLAGKS